MAEFAKSPSWKVDLGSRFMFQMCPNRLGWGPRHGSRRWREPRDDFSDTQDEGDTLTVCCPLPRGIWQNSLLPPHWCTFWYSLSSGAWARQPSREQGLFRTETSQDRMAFGPWVAFTSHLKVMHQPSFLTVPYGNGCIYIVKTICVESSVLVWGSLPVEQLYMPGTQLTFLSIVCSAVTTLAPNSLGLNSVLPVWD